MTISTDRLTLRALTREQMYAALADMNAALAELGLGIPPQKPDETALREQVYKRKCELMDLHPDYLPFCTTWLMALKRGKMAVGELGFKGPPVSGVLEIGYGTYYRYRNRGYMKEAVAALCRFGLSKPSVSAIDAYTVPENYASQNVLACCGFVPMDRDAKHLRFRLTSEAVCGVPQSGHTAAEV